MLEWQTQTTSQFERSSAAKRCIDVLASVILLTLVSPVLAAAAFAIAATSNGPILYLAQRCGLHARPFRCFKLRTMFVDQDLHLKGRNNVGSDGRLLVFEDDPRITKVGRILRKLSIDELPQLVNVLRGDMSLIGPRPLPLSMLESFPEIGAMRSAVRPGITGLWQVRNRKKNVSVLDMVDDDSEYIRTYSLVLDLKIALLTIPRVIEP